MLPIFRLIPSSVPPAPHRRLFQGSFNEELARKPLPVDVEVHASLLSRRRELTQLFVACHKRCRLDVPRFTFFVGLCCSVLLTLLIGLMVVPWALICILFRVDAVPAIFNTTSVPMGDLLLLLPFLLVCVPA